MSNKTRADLPHRASPSSRRPDTGRRRRLLFRLGLAGLAALVVVAVLAAVFNQRIFAAYNRRVAAYHVNAAREAAAQGNWETARNRARSALIKRSSDPEAARLWFLSMCELDDPAKIDGAIMAFSRVKDDPEVLAKALDVIRREAPQPVFISAYTSLSQEFRKRPEFLAALCRFVAARGQVADVEKLLRQTPDSDKEPPLMVELVRVLCADPTPQRIVEARHIFAQLVERSAEYPGEALEALRLLAWLPGSLDIGRGFPELEPWIESVPEARIPDRLVVMHQHLQDTEDSWDRAMDRAVNEFGPRDPAAVGRWLIRQDETERAIKLLSAPALTDPDAFKALMEAFMRTKKYEEAGLALSRAPETLSPVILGCLRAVVKRATGDEAAESAGWLEALDRAAVLGDRNHFLDIIAYAKVAGATSIAEEAWISAVKMGRGPIPFYADLRSLIDSLARKGRTRDLLDMARVQLVFEPENLELKHNFYYLAMLHDVVSPATAIPVFEELRAAEPDRAAIRASLAFAHLLNNDAKACLAIATELPADDPHVSSDLRASLIGCARVLVGETGSISDSLREVRWEGLAPREAEIFRDFFADLGAEQQIPAQLGDLVNRNQDKQREWERILEQRVDQKSDPEAAAQFSRFLENLEKSEPQPTPEMPGLFDDESTAPPDKATEPVKVSPVAPD